jgi:putative oxidoreductase
MSPGITHSAALVGRILLALILSLAIYTLAAGFLFHDFWNADAASKLDQTIHFWRNVSICGGMLMAFAFGAGRYSVDEATSSSNRLPSSLAA